MSQRGSFRGQASWAVDTQRERAGEKQPADAKPPPPLSGAGGQRGSVLERLLRQARGRGGDTVSARPCAYFLRGPQMLSF